MQPSNQRKNSGPRFPMFKHTGGQWTKKVKGRFYYFGEWKSDTNGDLALAEWLERKAGIEAGIDRLRVGNTPDAMTLAELMKRFLANRRNAMVAGELSPTTYGDYMREIQAFGESVGDIAQVQALTPAHFAAYGKKLIDRGLGRHARRRVIAYCKAMLNWGTGEGYFPTPTYGSGFTAPDTSPDAMRQARSRAGKKDHSGRIVTGSEIDQIMAASAPLFKAITLLAINCALGPADLGRLRWRHLNMDTGELNMPRGKTGTERKGYLWKKTRKALRRAATLKHNKLAIENQGLEALVFITRTGLPMYRESEILQDKVSVGVEVCNPISATFNRKTRTLKLEGVTLYRLRHTFKTLGKKARDKDALNLMMGHREGTTGEVYDHEEIDARRIKRVSVAVLHALWPQLPTKRLATPNQPVTRMRLAV
jgi:integrase